MVYSKRPKYDRSIFYLQLTETTVEKELLEKELEKLKKSRR